MVNALSRIGQESENFALQGREGGKAIIKCEDCGNGMLVGLIGRAKPIPEEKWSAHQAYMWEQFDSPEAQTRLADELEAKFEAIHKKYHP